MIERVLPLFGTGSLIAVVVFLGMKTAEVSRVKLVQPELAPALNISTTATPQNRIEQKPANYQMVITERPLFEPTRRPFVPIAPIPSPISDPEPEPSVETLTPTPPKELPPPNVTLQGIITGDDQNAALIIIDGGSPVWISKGNPVANWVLSDIGNNWIEISRDARSIRVDMYK